MTTIHDVIHIQAIMADLWDGAMPAPYITGINLTSLPSVTYFGNTITAGDIPAGHKEPILDCLLQALHADREFPASEVTE